jgi:hypothetical protein
MKKLIYSMLALFCVAFAFTSCDDDNDDPTKGTLERPYTVKEAINAVKNLTWTSNEVYDKTDEVFMKGIISRISPGGTYDESGIFANASFYISDDGTENNEFFCYRMLYFNKQKYESGQTDIKVGDKVVVCGHLMNYKNNTPETVANNAYLVSLNGAKDGGSSSTISFATNSDEQTWVTATDPIYGTGYSTTTQGLNIGYYQHNCVSSLVPPNANHVRIYKNSVLGIASTDGKKIKKIVIGCAPNSGTTSYCFDMAGLEGTADAVADKEALTITWNGSANRVYLLSNNAQVRMDKISVVFE